MQKHVRTVQMLIHTQLFFAKTDATSAFRLLPMSLDSRHWLVIKVRHPIRNQMYYFIDKCLHSVPVSAVHYFRSSRTTYVSWQSGGF